MFDAVSLLVILANCITLAMDDPTNDVQEQWQLNADYTFQALYTVELVLKSCGMGFVLDSGAYLRDPWNILDFIIVVFGYMAYMNISQGLDLKVLRSFRVLRPLRTITTIEGLRILMAALVSSLPLLLDTLIILGFFFMIFAIAGLQMWNGILTKRCLYTSTGEIDQNTVCGSHGCPEGAICVNYMSNPNFGATNFDNIFSALLTVFQCVTLEGWTDTMRYVAFAWSDFTVIYFALLVVLGSYFLLNFTLAVIKSRVSKTYDENRKLLLQKKNQKAEASKDKLSPISISLSLAGVKFKKVEKKAKKYHIEILPAQDEGNRKQDSKIVIDYFKNFGFPSDIDETIDSHPKIEFEEKKEVLSVSKDPLWANTEHAVMEASPSEEASSFKSNEPRFIRAPSRIRKNFIKALKKSSSETHQPKQRATLSGIEEFTNSLFTSIAPLCPKNYPSAIFIQDENQQDQKNESLESIIEFDESGSPRKSNLVEGKKPTSTFGSVDSFHPKKSPRASPSQQNDDSQPLHAPFQTMNSQKLLVEKRKKSAGEGSEEKKKRKIERSGSPFGVSIFHLQSKEAHSRPFSPATQASQPRNKDFRDSRESKNAIQHETGTGEQRDSQKDSTTLNPVVPIKKYVTQTTKDTSSTLSNLRKLKSNIVLHKLEVKKEDLDKKSEKSSNTEQPPQSPIEEINPEVLKAIRKEKLLLKDTTVEMTSADDVLEKRKNAVSNALNLSGIANKSMTQMNISQDESYIISSSFPSKPPYKLKVEYKVTVEPQDIFADEEEDECSIQEKMKIKRQILMIDDIEKAQSQMPDDSQSFFGSPKSHRDDRSNYASKPKKECRKIKKKPKKKSKSGKLQDGSGSQDNSLLNRSYVPPSRNPRQRNSLSNVLEASSILTGRSGKQPGTRRSSTSVNNIAKEGINAEHSSQQGRTY